MNHIHSPNNTDQGIEAEIQAKALKAPRITPEDIADNIVSEWYINAADGIPHKNFPAVHPLRQLTFCVLVLRNGFTVTGESACASPENFDPKIGRSIARENAVQKVWPLMGYQLKQELFEKASVPVSDFQSRLRAEHHELNERLGKLESVINGLAFPWLPKVEQADLRMQASQMREYSATLGRRLGRLLD